MTILVTGGAGFIGSHTVDLLLAEGFRVRVFDNFSKGKRDNLPDSSHLEIVVGDVVDGEAVARAMADVTHVLHLAAMISVTESIERPDVSCRDNALGFVRVVDAARKAGVKRIVYASSAAVYGAATKLPISEDDPTAPISFYGLDKLYDDQSAALYRQYHGLSMLGMRYFNVYGSRQDPKSPYAGVVSKFLDAVAADAPLTIFGDGLQTRDYIHVSDVARANLAALMTPEVVGVCNVATGKSITLNALVETLEALLGRTLAVNRLPEREGDIRFNAADAARLHQALSCTPSVSLTEGLTQLLSEVGCLSNGRAPR